MLTLKTSNLVYLRYICYWFIYYEASEHLSIIPLNGKRVKNLKKSAIIDQIPLKGMDASFEDFTILLKKSNKLKLHLIKEALLIKYDKPELNRNIYSYPLELFDWWLS